MTIINSNKNSSKSHLPWVHDTLTVGTVQVPVVHMMLESASPTMTTTSEKRKKKKKREKKKKKKKKKKKT